MVIQNRVNQEKLHWQTFSGRGKKEFVLITYLFICSYTFYIFICNNNMNLEQRRDGATISEEGMLKEFFFF